MHSHLKFRTKRVRESCLTTLLLRPSTLLIHHTVLIVGPSERSLGATCAIELAAARPAHILLAGRTRAKIEPVITAISATSPEIRVTFVETDLCSNASVAAAAETINSLVFSIHALLNAAGVMAVRTFEKSADGVERQFAANHLGAS